MEVNPVSHEVTVDGRATNVEAYAARLGREANQSSVLVFHEDREGSATRFRYHGFQDREAAIELTSSSGIEGASLGDHSMTVIAISDRHTEAAEEIARVLGVKPTRTRGTVVFV